MISKTIIILWTMFIAWGFLAGINDAAKVADPDSAAFAFAFMFGALFYFVLWAIVAMPTYMISRMFRKNPEECRRIGHPITR